jgi:hypothetical protein
MLYDLALTYQERSQRSEARILEQFQDSSEGLAAALGDSMVLDDEDERLWYRASGAFEAEVVPETDDDGEPSWQALTTRRTWSVLRSEYLRTSRRPSPTSTRRRARAR